jgi:hypothetical protein
MGYGRDAVDVALTTSFGTTRLEKFVVWTDEVADHQGNGVQERRSAQGWNATSQI